MSRKNLNNLRNKNRLVGLSVFAVFIFMVGLGFASVPLYKLFCSVTGFGGTIQVSTSLPDTIIDRIITVKFNADTARDLPWNFKPEQRQIDIRPGQKALISYRAKNQSSHPVAGTALYNVSPPKAGRYFHKIECFCFGEQILNPGEDVSMPVVFFIDPKIADDRSMNDVNVITLSYDFFKTESAELDKALEEFYNNPTEILTE